MLAELSAAVYMDWPVCFQVVDMYCDDRFTIKEFDSQGAQAVAFKLDMDTAVVVFRGTETDEWKDILANIKAWPTESETAGSVHSGFKTELDKIYSQVMIWIRSRAVNKNTTIYISGHSLGAAMASIFASRLHILGYNVILYTYGSPRVGDQDWVDQLNSLPAFRFVNNSDLVCQVPPYGLYSHVGQIYYMNYEGSISNRMTYWQRLYDRIKSTLKAYSKLQFFNGIYDHAIHRYIRKILGTIRRTSSHR
jgi:triacylglycerol lipase